MSLRTADATHAADRSHAKLSLATTLAAGFVGTVVLNLFESVEWRRIGREPLYSPRHIARRLAPTGVTNGTARRIGEALRWTYGPALGALLSGRCRGRGTLSAGLRVGAAIYAFEVLVAPAVGATPRLRDWPRRELASLLAHTSVFGIAAVAACRLLGGALRSGGAPPSVSKRVTPGAGSAAHVSG